MTGVCPCCGQAVPEGDFLVSLDTNTCSRWGRVIELQPQQAEVLSIIKRAGTKGATISSLYLGLYGVKGGPPKGSNTLNVRLHWLRRRLAPLGVQIENVWGRSYRLKLSERSPELLTVDFAGRAENAA